ncbi:LemA family protein [Budviciaceae bacterium CWB-B4]|uniref:LemA family protein n=1 Tax=Limnobaculum xujianqingii TaxID=2738837 RepID=A0A9D7AL37_9GAMM|nr:LemA family protein [Limnobaculum xujianqingii]MBK5074701.1 LemA family protein [Limnobaculum xujianqingii]MBK5177967.1 LemA family protein [Limnobaculum xujianqingii]
MNSLIALVIVVVLALLIVRYLVVLYNKIVTLKNYVEKSFANIDVLLKQRADEIPELIKVAEKVMTHQSELFIQLAQLRNRYLTSRKTEEKVQSTNQTDTLLQQIFMLAENYPELKAIHNLTALQQRISLLENRIADRREFFNQSVMLYNIGIQEFPNIILAKLLGYQSRSLLNITEGEKQYAGITL